MTYLSRYLKSVAQVQWFEEANFTAHLSRHLKSVTQLQQSKGATSTAHLSHQRYAITAIEGSKSPSTLESSSEERNTSTPIQGPKQPSAIERHGSQDIYGGLHQRSWTPSPPRSFTQTGHQRVSTTYQMPTSRGRILQNRANNRSRDQTELYAFFR